MSIGKIRRIHKFFDNKKSLIVPVDDSLINGPKEGLLDIDNTIRSITKAKPNGLLCFKGTLIRHHKELLDTPVILNLTASTTLSRHTQKAIISSVEESLSLGADAIAVHINTSSQYENEMLSMIGGISRECEILGMPLLVISYPRKELNSKDDNYLSLKKTELSKYTDLIQHSVRVAVDLGADIIKTHFTGTLESFEQVIKASCSVPVLIAGGEKVQEEIAVTNAEMAIKAGASGVCFGRNTYNRSNVCDFISQLKQVVLI
jgi:DhnA family fructose-bisphosphate aldolase class Ia